MARVGALGRSGSASGRKATAPEKRPIGANLYVTHPQILLLVKHIYDRIAHILFARKMPRTLAARPSGPRNG